MNMVVFWVLAGGLCLTSILLGMQGGRKQEKSVHEFFACQSNLRLMSLMLTILATQLGGGSVIGSAEAAYQNGWVAIFYSLGIALGLMIMAFTVGPALRKFGAFTMAQVLGDIYRSRRLHIIASLLSIITLFLILVATGVSCRKVFLSLGFDSPWMLIGFWSVLIGYTILGGLRAVVITDKLQVLFILGVFVLIIALLGDRFIPMLNSDVLMSTGKSEISWSSWVLMPLCFMLISQDMGQRCFAAESDQGIRRAMIGGSCLLVVATLVPVFVGMLGRYLGLSVNGGSIFMAVVEATLSPALISFVAIAVLMAIISTADSLLCAISSNVALDFLKSKTMKQSRWVTFVIGVFSLALSFYEGDVIPVMIVGYEISVFGLLVPFLMGLWLKDVSEKQALISLGIGVAGFLSMKFITFPGMELVILGAAMLPYIKGLKTGQR
jgi:SSS family solute:Na+ symporter